MDSGKEVTLDDGFRQLQIPLANQRFVRRIVDVIGIDRFVSTSTYLRAVRSDEGPDLRIAYGWTNGFVSRDEARHAAGDAAVIDPSPDRAGQGLFGVRHPENKIRDGSGASTSKQTGMSFCPQCGYALLGDGTCENCSA